MSRETENEADITSAEKGARSVEKRGGRNGEAKERRRSVCRRRRGETERERGGGKEGEGERERENLSNKAIPLWWPGVI